MSTRAEQLISSYLGEAQLPPALLSILGALTRGPQDERGIRGRTGHSAAEIRAFMTRLLFLGLVRKEGTRYAITAEGFDVAQANPR